ncbi:histidine-type phosphatase [Salmonella enterica]|nr:histidine-type phosphatase [Salmonella enterica]EKU4665020.1 histidine-type phosphatase [Citrobacter freundii]HDX8776011.1 histidine-type phosphatase [Klebsiella oxytoca]EIL1869086.1 histidine-type phosphatase [Salmonella enterica]ELH4154167.1 histidine-type phosphatase [Salmonella enterica]
MISAACMACSTSIPMATAAASNNLVLEKVVTMTRHGVRSQSNSASVQENSPTPIPAFSAKDGELTMHGYAAVTLMGDYLHRYFVSQKFLTENTCPDAKNIFIRSSAFQRTRMTANALADSLFPGCAIPIHSPDKKTDDTLFEPIVSGMAPLNVEKATQSVMTALGGSFDTARQRYASQMTAMQKVVDPTCQLPECTFVNHKWEIKADKQNINISLKGPIAKGSELGETFRLQYTEGMPIKDVAFGHVNRATDLAPLMQLKEIKFDLIEHNPYIAARGGSQLMSQILYALEKGSGYKDPGASPQIRDSAPDARMVMYVAHDTNLGYLQPLLNVSWDLQGYPKDDTPPGSSLLFERYRDTKTQKIYVGVSFMTQTLDQIRRLETLSNKNPPLQQKLDLNCKNSPDGWLCPIDEFAAQVNSRLDKTAMIAQNYAE